MRRTRKRQLLRDLAKALDSCEKAGVNVKLRHGIVFTDIGYVLPVKDRWVARTLKQLRK